MDPILEFFRQFNRPKTHNPWASPSGEPMCVVISSDDEERKAAHRMASETIDDFINHIAVGDGRLCSFKLHFRDPELEEDELFYWWLDWAAYYPADGHFSGVFSELPDCLKSYYHIGQRLHALREDIFDWRVNLDGRLYGGFTIRVDRKTIPSDQLKAYDRYIGVTSFEETTEP